MQISLRSQLIAGTAAVVGASAIAMTPVTAAHLSLPSMQGPTSAQTALVAFSSPLAQLSLTTALASNYLFNTFATPTDLLTDGEPTWAFSGFTGVLPAALGLGLLGGYTSVGLIPQIIDDALPIVSQLGYNGSDYLQATATSVAASGYVLGQGLWTAGGQLLSFDLPGAIETVLQSVSEAGTYLLTAGGYVLSGVVGRATAVIETIIELVPTLLGATLRQVQVVGDSVGAVFNNFFDAFGTATPIESAWNAVIDGLLGPSGIPGTLMNITIGAGVQTGPIAGPGDIAENFVPSIRTEVQAGVKAIAGALATPVAPLAASTPAPAAAVSEAPAAVAAVAEAPAAVAEVAEVEAPAAVEAPAPVEAPVAVAGDSDSEKKASTPKRSHRTAKKASSE